MCFGSVDLHAICTKPLVLHRWQCTFHRGALILTFSQGGQIRQKRATFADARQMRKVFKTNWLAMTYDFLKVHWCAWNCMYSVFLMCFFQKCILLWQNNVFLQVSQTLTYGREASASAYNSSVNLWFSPSFVFKLRHLDHVYFLNQVNLLLLLNFKVKFEVI